MCRVSFIIPSSVNNSVLARILHSLLFVVCAKKREKTWIRRADQFHSIWCVVVLPRVSRSRRASRNENSADPRRGLARALRAHINSSCGICLFLRAFTRFTILNSIRKVIASRSHHTRSVVSSAPSSPPCVVTKIAKCVVVSAAAPRLTQVAIGPAAIN